MFFNTYIFFSVCTALVYGAWWGGAHGACPWGPRGCRSRKHRIFLLTDNDDYNPKAGAAAMGLSVWFVHRKAELVS